jgi:hypothetical protein
VGVRLNLRFDFSGFFIGNDLESFISEEAGCLILIHFHSRILVINGAEFVHNF